MEIPATARRAARVCEVLDSIAGVLAILLVVVSLAEARGGSGIVLLGCALLGLVGVGSALLMLAGEDLRAGLRGNGARVRVGLFKAICGAALVALPAVVMTFAMGFRWVHEGIDFQQMGPDGPILVGILAVGLSPLLLAAANGLVLLLYGRMFAGSGPPGPPAESPPQP